MTEGPSADLIFTKRFKVVGCFFYTESVSAGEYLSMQGCLLQLQLQLQLRCTVTLRYLRYPTLPAATRCGSLLRSGERCIHRF